MSKKGPALSKERQEEVIAEFVDMYIEKGGEYPTSRDIKKNKYISEEEVAFVKRLGLLEDWRVRKMAQEKTGINYPSSNKRRIEHIKNTSQDRDRAKATSESLVRAAEKIVKQEGEVEMAEVAREPIKPIGTAEVVNPATEATKELANPVEIAETTISAKEKASRRVDIKELKRVLREFGEKNLRWPTDAEAKEFSQAGIPGWIRAANMRHRLGDKTKWGEQIFPEGLPDGFTIDSRCGRQHKKTFAVHQKEPTARKIIPSSSNDLASLKERANQISQLVSSNYLDTMIETSNYFTMKSELAVEYKGKLIKLIFEIYENAE